MKRAIYAILAVIVLTSLTGCLLGRARRPAACTAGSCAQAPENCASRPCSGSVDNSEDPNQQSPCHTGGLLGDRLRRGGIDGGEGDDGEGFAPGPPSGAVAYPYYTTRGPRDFLARNPQSIGP
jgi:hypothetical protein